MIATGAWCVLFGSGAGERSLYLAPVWHLLARTWLFPNTSVPVLIWYLGLVLHWPILGALGDVLRWWARRPAG